MPFYFLKHISDFVPFYNKCPFKNSHDSFYKLLWLFFDEKFFFEKDHFKYVKNFRRGGLHMMCYKRGDIFWAKLGEETEGSLQTGARPVLIVSNDKANEFSSVITIIPITSKMKKKLPTHVLIKECGLEKPSIALAEQITSINKERLERKIGSIQQTVYVRLVKKAIEIQLNL